MGAVAVRHLGPGKEGEAVTPELHFSKEIRYDGGGLLIQRKQGDSEVTLRVLSRRGLVRTISRLRPETLAELVTALKDADPGMGTRNL